MQRIILKIVGFLRLVVSQSNLCKFSSTFSSPILSKVAQFRMVFSIWSQHQKTSWLQLFCCFSGLQFSRQHWLFLLGLALHLVALLFILLFIWLSTFEWEAEFWVYVTWIGWKVEEQWFRTFFDDGTKLKITSKIKPPLLYEKMYIFFKNLTISKSS